MATTEEPRSGEQDRRSLPETRVPTRIWGYMSPSTPRSGRSNAWENVRALAGVAFVAAPTMVGCTVSPSSDSVDAESAAQSSAAIVIVERTAGPGDAVHGDDVVARFIRVQGSIDDATLRVVGVSTEIPAVGTCVDVEGNGVARAPGATTARGVELLDVGAVTLEDPQAPPGKNTELLPRVMPDPAGVVSGVIYSARANDAFTPGSGLRLRASGGPDATEGFVAQFRAPRDVANARVVVGAGGVDVTWDASEAEPRDLVYVELLTPSSTTVRRCTSLDAGHLFIGFGDATTALDEGQVVVHRLRREPFQGKGVPDGEVRFDVARILTYTR